jgi:polar amino acid transport system permease protein
MMWNWSFAWHILPTILHGMVITIEATILGMLLALVLGLFWAGLLLLPNRWIFWSTRGITEFIRDTPLLIQLFFCYYVLPEIGITIPALLTGITVLGINYSAYTAEVYRAGLQNIPRGQWDAAKALNFTTWQTFTRIILPQAIPPIVPAMGNNLIAMFKDTPLLSTITVMEMLDRAMIIGDKTFRYLEPLTMVGILFLIISLMASALIGFTQRKILVRR